MRFLFLFFLGAGLESETLMKERVVNALQNPPSLHLACTLLTVPVVQDFVRDLRIAVDETKSGEGKSDGSMVMLCPSFFSVFCLGDRRGAELMDWAAQMDSAARVRSDLGWSRSSLRGVSGFPPFLFCGARRGRS